jgi:hypothetical protein
MLNAKALRYESMLRFHHVDIPIMGKLSLEAVTRFRRTAQPYAVSKNKIVFASIKRLAFSKECLCQRWRQLVRRRPGCAVQ